VRVRAVVHVRVRECVRARVDVPIPALVGIKKLPQKDDYNDFDITTLVGGLFFALILHQLLPVFLSVLHFSKCIEELTVHTTQLQR
jgi:hypothetical protein